MSDVTGWPQILPTFTSVQRCADSPAVTGVGARYEVRQPGLRAAVYEVTEWEPGRSFTWVARSTGVVTTARHAVAAIPTGAKVTLDLEWSGVLAPVLRFLLGRKARGMVQLEADTFASLAAAGG